MTGENRRWLSAVLMLVLAASVGLTVRGQAPKPNKDDTWMMKGAATIACGALTSDLRTGRSVWEGYYRNAGVSFLSGANFHASLTHTGDPDVGAHTSPEAVLAAVEFYCGSHPFDDVGGALADEYVRLAAIVPARSPAHSSPARSGRAH
jgi:hypothetical protein